MRIQTILPRINGVIIIAKIENAGEKQGDGESESMAGGNGI